MKIFNSIGHFFAWVFSKAKAAAPVVESVASDVAAGAQSPLAQAIVTQLGSKGTAVQSGIEAIAGDVLSAFDKAGAAIGAEGLNVQFDQATVEAIETLYRDLATLFHPQADTAAPAAVLVAK